MTAPPAADGSCPAGPASEVHRCGAAALAPVRALLARYGLSLRMLDGEDAIPGSYWGAPEAGLIGATVYATVATPVHSVLHEAAHYVCMTPERRANLHTDAGGDCLEEAGVCYLQVLWAEELTDLGRARMLADMDAWGYSFRLGSARAWFENDAEDARVWLESQGLLQAGRPAGRVRG